MSRRIGHEFAQEREQGFTPTISSLAFLKVNYDRQGKDYFGNFVPMVAECIKRSPADVISLRDLQSDLRDQFGLSLPQNAIRTVLKRARRRGYVSLESGVYYPNRDELERLGFRNEQRRVIEEHDALVRKLSNFALSISRMILALKMLTPQLDPSWKRTNFNW